MQLPFKVDQNIVPFFLFPNMSHSTNFDCDFQAFICCSSPRSPQRAPSGRTRPPQPRHGSPYATERMGEACMRCLEEGGGLPSSSPLGGLRDREPPPPLNQEGGPPPGNGPKVLARRARATRVPCAAGGGGEFEGVQIYFVLFSIRLIRPLLCFCPFLFPCQSRLISMDFRGPQMSLLPQH